MDKLTLPAIIGIFWGFFKPKHLFARRPVSSCLSSICRYLPCWQSDESWSESSQLVAVGSLPVALEISAHASDAFTEPFYSLSLIFCYAVKSSDSEPWFCWRRVNGNALACSVYPSTLGVKRHAQNHGKINHSQANRAIINHLQLPFVLLRGWRQSRGISLHFYPISTLSSIGSILYYPLSRSYVTPKSECFIKFVFVRGCLEVNGNPCG